MGTTLELIKELHDRRRGLIEQFKERHAAVEAGTGGAEEQAKVDELNSEIGDLGTRIQNLVSMQEHEKQDAEDRQRFENLITQSTATGLNAADEFNAKVRAWLRAGLPNAEAWAPRALTFESKDVTVKHFSDGRYEVHDLTKGTATDGAELIASGFLRELFEHMIEFAGVRRTNARILTTGNGENVLVPKTTTYGAAALVAEAAAIGENDPQFGQVTLNAYKYGQLIQVSRELVEDSAVDLIPFLARAAGRTLGVVTGTAYVTGTGSSQPEGIANSPTAGKTGTTGQTTTVIANDLVDLYHSIVSGYRANAYWVMLDATAAFIRKIRDDTGGAGLGNFVWQPGLQAGAPDTIFGRPVVTDPNVATMAANAHSIFFGDFSEYFIIRDVSGVRFERSDDFAFANDLVTFRALLRTDSKQVINGSGGAVKSYRNSAT